MRRCWAWAQPKAHTQGSPWLWRQVREIPHSHSQVRALGSGTASQNTWTYRLALWVYADLQRHFTSFLVKITGIVIWVAFYVLFKSIVRLQSTAKEQKRAHVYEKTFSQARDKLTYRLLAETLCCWFGSHWCWRFPLALPLPAKILPESNGGRELQLKTKMIFTGIKRNWGHYNFIIILTIIQINLSHKLPFHKPTGIRLKYFVTQLLTESFE